ncbi:MAG: hypothetical protein HDS10_00185 [Bacteroides sp.]|nr:hypothetical protein [Bacteroides sp.]
MADTEFFGKMGLFFFNRKKGKKGAFKISWALWPHWFYGLKKLGFIPDIFSIFIFTI